MFLLPFYVVVALFHICILAVRIGWALLVLTVTLISSAVRLIRGTPAPTATHRVTLPSGKTVPV